ncbi:MAG TPA: ABC transporter substrate-binding protein [Saprospiraceae bacterium]|nr:ABC transporter substrate-binding protein [Saprospiraceae bacterium]
MLQNLLSSNILCYLPIRYSFSFVFISLLLLLSSCNSNIDNDKEIAKRVFTYNQPNSVTSLDPAFARSMTNIWAIDHIYNGLLQLDDSLHIKYCIAKSWNIDSSGRVYTFILRNDVLFHNSKSFAGGQGRRVIASDVVYSFNRILDTKISSPGSWIFKGRVDSITPFSALNDSVFQLHLMRPFKPMLGILTMQYCSIIPHEAIEYYGNEFRKNPVGTGPYKLKRWIENQTLYLNRNPYYFEKENGHSLPYMDGIRIEFIADRKSAFLKFIKGDLDLFSGLESSYINALLTPDGKLQNWLDKKVNYNKNPFLNTEFIGINTTKLPPDHPLRNKYFRRALNCSINRAKMLSLLRNNVGKPADSGIIPFGMPAYNPNKVKGYAYDVTEAKNLLSKAGFPDGNGLPVITLHCNKDYADICTFLARQWQEINIPINIEVVESATLREMMRNGTTSFFRASWVGDYPDEENYLSLFYSKNAAPPNYTRFSNSQYDLLYEKALNTNDPKEINNLYNEMNSIVVEQAPVILLWYDETAQFYGKNVSGLHSNIMNLLSVKRIRKN